MLNLRIDHKKFALNLLPLHKQMLFITRALKQSGAHRSLTMLKRSCDTDSFSAFKEVNSFSLPRTIIDTSKLAFPFRALCHGTIHLVILHPRWVKGKRSSNRRSSEIQGTALDKSLRAWTCIYRSMPAGVAQNRHAFVGGTVSTWGRWRLPVNKRQKRHQKCRSNTHCSRGTCRSDSRFPQLVV